MNEEISDALKEYTQAALGDSRNESLVLDVSRRLIQAKQLDQALRLMTNAAAQPNASGAVYARLGVVHAQLGHADQAIAANRAAIKRSPTSLLGYENLFLHYLRARDGAQALATLDLAARQSRVSADYLIGLSELYVGLGSQIPAQKDVARARALEILKRAAKMKPEGAPLRLQMADGFNALGDSSEAASLYLELLKTLPDIPQVCDRVRAKLTDIYIRTEDRQRALEQLEQMVRDNPTNPQARYFLGALYLESRKPTEAAEQFRKAIQLNPNLEQAYYDLAIASLDLQKPAEALITLSDARAKFRASFVLEYLTGSALSRQKEFTAALQHFTAAEVMAKASEPARLTESFYFQYGATLERAGDIEQAEKYFQKCLTIAPDMPEALNYLGYMWAERGVKLQEARGMIEKALKAEPKNPAYLDSLGWVFFKLGQPKDALPLISEAVELEKEPDATLYDHLGDIHAALNEMDKARAAWQKSFDTEPKEEVRKKLESSPK